MKNKKMTYILISGVLFVWGMIFYRIWNNMSSEEIPALSFKKVSTFQRDAAEKQDTFFLLANYRDPFLGKEASRIITTVPKKKILVPVKPKEPEVKLDWSFISYLGLIKNPQTDKKVVLVNIKGRQYMISEGQTIEDVTLVKNYKDSIKVSFEGKVNFLKR